MGTEPTMDRVTAISSGQNPRIKALAKLRRGGERRASDVVVVEGHYEISVAAESGSDIVELYYSPDVVAAEELDLGRAAGARGARVFALSAAVFKKISYRQNPDGWLAVLRRFETRLEALTLPACPLLVVCSAVEKPGNLGAILRSADAAGVDAVVSTEAVTDWGNPNVVRASRGTVFTVPVADSSAEVLVPWLRDRGIRLLAAAPHGDVPFTSARMDAPVAIVVGSEQLGLSADWLDAADTLVTIPMVGRVNSLNVATSAALLMYEARRQREASPAGG